MALTLPLLEAIEGLTEDQKKAIVELSTNDEIQVVEKARKEAENARTREIYDGLDADMEKLGYKKPEGSMRSFQHIQNVVKELDGKVKKSSEFETQVSDLTSKLKDYEKQLKDNTGDKALKEKVVNLEKQNEGLIKQIGELKETHTKEIEKAAKELEEEKQSTFNVRVTNEWNKVLHGITYKSGYSETALKELLEIRKAKAIKEGMPFFTDENKLRFKDKDEGILTNPQNLMKPHTPESFFLSYIDDLIDKDKTQTGLGTGKKGGKGGSTLALEFEGVKTKSEANKLIEQLVMKEGIARHNPKFGQRRRELKTQNKAIIDALPE